MGRKAWRRAVVGWALAIWAAAACYFSVGCLYGALGLYLYNVRNWPLYGRLSFPPLFFPLGFIFDLFLWPLYLWADWINKVGIFGPYGPLWGF